MKAYLKDLHEHQKRYGGGWKFLLGAVVIGGGAMLAIGLIPDMALRFNKDTVHVLWVRDPEAVKELLDRCFSGLVHRLLGGVGRLFASHRLGFHGLRLCRRLGGVLGEAQRCELGHALGLKHGHEVYEADPPFFPARPAMTAAHDSMEFSVMTYRSYVGADLSGYTNETFGYAQSLMMYDIAALQRMYGADFATNSGDSVYTWNPSTGAFMVNGAIFLVAVKLATGLATGSIAFLAEAAAWMVARSANAAGAWTACRSSHASGSARWSTRSRRCRTRAGPSAGRPRRPGC